MIIIIRKVHGDNLIDHNDAKEDDKLLFSSFIAAHPALEHFGGVARGGTFVLAYDDNANVVADFMLPYYAADPDRLRLAIYPAGHTVTPQMERDAADWFSRHLLGAP